MKYFLNASEKLGDINISGKTEAEKLKDVEKVFRNILQQPKDTIGGFLNTRRYDAAMKDLTKADKGLADQIDAVVKPIVKELEVKRVVFGEGFEKGYKEGGFIKKTLGDIGNLAIEGANLTAAAAKAAREGKTGPVPFLPTSTLMKPTVSVLSTTKNIIDKELSRNPKNKTMAMFSGMLKNAIEQQDEGRRAAMLNTLMQYPTFRNLIKTEKE